MRAKMKAEEKLPYIYNHISTVEEFLEIAQKHLKWLSDDVKFIKKISKPKEETVANTRMP